MTTTLLCTLLVLAFVGSLTVNYFLMRKKPEEIKKPEQKVTLTEEKLQEIFYDATPEVIEEFYTLFNRYANSFMIETEVQENFFFAQIFVEVGPSLQSVRENLNYSCDALKSTFSYYNNSPSEADQDGRCGDHEADQVSIGNKAYASRIGNGSVESGDGYMFRGGGYFQLTGRANYQMIVDNINERTQNIDFKVEDYANKIAKTRQGLLGALSFWEENECYLCNDIDCVTAKVNYYTDSYDERKDAYYWIADL